MLRGLAPAALALCAALQPSAAFAAQPAGAGADDHSAIYRYDPFLEDVVAVAPADVKPGYLYSRYSPQLDRRVWSVAVPGGGFRYAMAPGSVQPARALDLRATPEEMRRELAERAPEVARMMDVRGGIAHVQLTDQGAWALVQHPTIPNVMDLETGRRWEWHGQRRVAVVHTGGPIWSWNGGETSPVFAFYALPFAACP